MLTFFLVVSGLAAVSVAIRFAVHPNFDPWAARLSFAQTVLTIVGLLAAAGWYFVERPHAVKVKVEQAAEVVPHGADQAMIIMELTLENVGDSTVDFRGAPFDLYLLQVTPLTKTPLSEIQPIATRVRTIHTAETFALRASLRRSATKTRGTELEHQPALTSLIDAGEVENLYFRVVVPASRT